MLRRFPAGKSHPYDPAASKSFTCGYLRNVAAFLLLPCAALDVRVVPVQRFRYGIGHFHQSYGDGSGLSGVMATERIELGRYRLAARERGSLASAGACEAGSRCAPSSGV